MVSFHESIHAQIFYATTDGFLLRSALVRSAHVPLTAERRQMFEAVAAELLRTARAAHEAIATYMGITVASDTGGHEWKDQLPREYQEYFETVARVVDKVSPAPSMRAWIALNIALVVFCSPLLQRVQIRGWRAIVEGIEAECSSNIRLGEVLNTVERQYRGLRSLIQTRALGACAQLGVELWDLDDHSAWGRMNPEIAERLQRMLASDLQHWFAATSCVSLLEDPEREQAERWLARDLIADGIPAIAYGNARRGQIEGPVSGEELAMADADFDSRIVNPLATTPREMEPDLSESPLIVSPLFRCVISLTVDAENDGWDMLGWVGDDGPRTQPSVTRFGMDELRALLCTWNERTRRGLPTARLLALVIPVHSHDEVSGWRARIELMCPHAVAAISWYWLGKWSVLAHGQLQTGAPLRVTTYAFRDPNHGEKHRLLTLVYLLNAGVFFRCLTPAACVRVEIASRFMRENGLLFEIPPDLKERLGPRIMFSALGVVPIRGSF